MNTRLLTCFVTAVECGSFTQAAEQLFTTQPNFSKQIAKLEQELGCKLFERVHRTVILTPAGQVFYDQVKDIPARLEEAVQSSRRTWQAEKNCLHIGILEGQLLRSELLQSFSTFRQQNPNCSLQISRCDFSALTAGLEHHRFDLILTILFTVEPRPGIASKVLYPQQLFAAVNLQNPLAKKDALTPPQLAGETVVTLEESCSPASFRQLQNTLKGVQVKRLVVSSTEALLTSIEANMGIAIVDGQNRLRNNPTVRLIPLSSKAKAPDFGAVWLENNAKPEVASMLCLL